MKFSKVAIDVIAKGSKYKAKPKEKPPLPLVPEKGEYVNDSFTQVVLAVLLHLTSSPKECITNLFRISLLRLTGVRLIIVIGLNNDGAQRFLKDHPQGPIKQANLT